MSDFSKFYKARDIISDIMQKDLVGPVDHDEVISELPTQYYIMGKLYPQGQSEEENDFVTNPFLENEAETYDASISLSNQKNPASMGVTCALKPGITEIILSGSYAFYDMVLFENAERSGIDINRWNDKDKKPSELWVRHEYEYNEKIILGEEKVTEPIFLKRDIQLQVFTHAIYDNGERMITVAVVNTNLTADDPKEKAQKCAFQVDLKISSPEDENIFASTDRHEYLSSDEEQMELQLLYSDILCYAQGHGCSVVWDIENEDPLWISSAWFPSFDLHPMRAGQIDDTEVLSMEFLATAPAISVIQALKCFAELYEEWISRQKNQISTLDKRLQEAAETNMTRCENAYQRICRSIDLLEEDAESEKGSMKAFQMANEAMLLQRKKTMENSGKPFESEKAEWYPFQLAFILHEISSFIDPEGEERKLVDLLWFPTGGGKTEAYLGVSAFVIFLRRLKNPDDDGVTIIMRYTLRLLTIQQFQRASILICACELLRKKYNLGGQEISIGLWVGGKLTPNDLKKANENLLKRKRGEKLHEADPCQIELCPWCGEKLSPDDYEVKEDEQRMIIHCRNEKCDFHEFENGLPLHIIDSAVYANLPTFIVATVDKFAQIPLNDKPAALFGISSHKNPPELIIQDEMHLISGPLGTMTGIYEAAITKLCEKNGVGAKIIASTATVRNAGNQIKSLYGREYSQFPPQGISARDSYFAVESKSEEKPTRKYFGVMGIGTTTTTTLVRTYAALLFASRYLAAKGFDDVVVDNYWTITGYFNSLRELGGASTQIMDDVQSRFKYLGGTKFASMEPNVDITANYDYKEELTSRMNNSDITKIIQERLNRSYRDGLHSDVYDFVLASNMISVGIDIGRLGTMVVAGQPKTNAEYIQATSRVGRENPGMVFTVYNSTRSRDRSHYEQFLKYHSALYRYVEATSLTPFADRARDRGLQALYVSLCRYLVPGMLENDHAGFYDPENENVKKIYDIICEYVKIVDLNELDAVREELEIIKDDWDAAAFGSLSYMNYRDKKSSLLKPDIENDRFRIMNSMRSVDAQSGIYLLGRQ